MATVLVVSNEYGKTFSDDDLGMDSEYEYDSDNSVEGIYIILANHTLIIILIVYTYLTKSRRQ